MKILQHLLKRFIFVMKDERGFLQTLVPLATAAFSMYSKNRQAKKAKGAAGGVIEPMEVDPRNPERRAADEFLMNFLNTHGSKYNPGQEYGGKFTAGMSPYEGRGVEEFLTNFLDTPAVSRELGDVRGMLNKTVSGGFDPGSSDYYKALRTESEYNRRRAIDTQRRDLGARNKFFSSEAVQKEGDINAQSAMDLNRGMLELADKERSRSMQAAPYAANLEEFISNVPLRKAEAATSIGALPRILEQADLESIYQDFLRRRKEEAGVLNAASMISSGQTRMEYPDPPLEMQPQKSASTDFLYKTISSLMNGGGNSMSQKNGVADLIPYLTQMFAR